MNIREAQSFVDDQLMTVQEAVLATGLTDTAIYNKLASHELPHIIVKGRKLLAAEPVRALAIARQGETECVS